MPRPKDGDGSRLNPKPAPGTTPMRGPVFGGQEFPTYQAYRGVSARLNGQSSPVKDFVTNPWTIAFSAEILATAGAETVATLQHNLQEQITFGIIGGLLLGGTGFLKHHLTKMAEHDEFRQSAYRLGDAHKRLRRSRDDALGALGKEQQAHRATHTWWGAHSAGRNEASGSNGNGAAGRKDIHIH